MKKKPRHPGSPANEGKKTPRNRGRPRKTLPDNTRGFCHEDGDAAADESAFNNTSEFRVGDVSKGPETKSKNSGRLTTAICRLCHGKFSPRSLRHAFNRWSRSSVDDESDVAVQSPPLFHSDFQQLVGVRLNRDPRLSDFICKKCHAKFYKCHSVLVRFLQRVNLPANGKENSKNQKNNKCLESSVNHESMTSLPSFTSDSRCLHSLVSWAHHHGEACRSCPDLKEVLEGQYCGSVRAVWGCVDGHSYIMDTHGTNAGHVANVSGGGGGGAFKSSDAVMSEVEEPDLEQQEVEEGVEEHWGGRTSAGSLNSAVTTSMQNSVVNDWTSCDDRTSQLHDHTETSPFAAQPQDRTNDSDLSDRMVSEEEFEDRSKEGLLDEDQLFTPYPDKRARRVTVPNKRRRNAETLEEPKIKKKPGPKPGWKNKFKPKGEELPNIYKCPYQGCTAVYRAPDGLKKHIKEHHEEVRERPCPHPGCNKVFMIDRYLQRHVKLIHTEERNYICDQCGQTFKQRKHLSVHQMRHSGAKPLQCEVCGFQCRQRASLKYHMTKHKAEAELEFACLVCGKRFEKAHNLNVHMSMVHPVIQTEAQRSGAQQQPPLPPSSSSCSDLHTITLSGEVVRHEQDR